MDVFITLEGDFLLNTGRFHCKAVMTALEVLMAQNRAANNGQVGIGAYKIMGEGLDKIQQLFKGGLIDLHGNMLGIENDAMLVVINIGAVLQAPGLIADGNRHDPVIGTGRMVHASGITFVFHTQLALGVCRLGSVLGSSNGLGVLLRFAQIDGDIQLAVLALILPAHILLDAITADVVGIAGEFIIPVSSINRRHGILFPEGINHLPGHGSNGTHDSGIENIPGSDAVITDTFGNCIVQNACQNLFQILTLGFIGGFIIIFAENIQQTVGQHLMIQGVCQSGVHGIRDQRINVGFDFHPSTSISTPPWGRIERT